MVIKCKLVNLGSAGHTFLLTLEDGVGLLSLLVLWYYLSAHVCFVVLPPKNVDVGSFLVSHSIATAGSLFPSCFFLWAMLLLAEDFLVKADTGIG